MKKIYLSIVIGLLLIGLLAACGGSGDTTTEQAEVEGEEETDASGGASVNTIEEGKLTFGSSGLYKPFNFEDLDGNETGFEVELGEAIAKEMGLEPNPVFTQDFGALIEEVNTDRIDVILGSLTITEERAEAVDFSEPYYTSGPVFYVHKDTDDIESWDDLEGKEVGVIANSVYEDTVLEHISEDQLSTYQSDTVALQDLAAGSDRLDMVLTDKIVGLVQIDENNLEIKSVGELIFEEKIGAAVKKGNQELLDEINRALEAIIENGIYEELSEKWFGESILE
ncbi:transporter substrate-binding domain-containing protein [Pseudogracilibacillus sp. SE30717A]|uniref:transporter substrate-binding domain-containing protein n=1 Tax=Pseudogracilibacillus sp. SE30717A TaxID=3098293 RepID=UPI00300E4B8A